MTKVKQKVYLLSEQQRNALLSYLLNQPYREVAGGVEFLQNAPTTMVNIEVPGERLESVAAVEESKSGDKEESTNKEVEVMNSSEEETAVFSGS